MQSTTEDGTELRSNPSGSVEVSGSSQLLMMNEPQQQKGVIEVDPPAHVASMSNNNKLHQ